MEIKILFLVFLSLLVFTNGVSLNGHQVVSSNDLAHGHEHSFGFHAMPRKLMLNPKVEGFEDKELVSYNEDLSGESHKGGDEAAAASSKVTMQEGSNPTRMFTMDYSPVRKRRPVHNKSFPTTTTSP